MNTEESMAEANRILGEAGWIAHPDWEGAYAKGSLVGGIHPNKRGCSIKDWMKIQPGHPLHSADTPDEPHEAAAWLVRSVARAIDKPTTEIDEQTVVSCENPEETTTYADAVPETEELTPSTPENAMNTKYSPADLDEKWAVETHPVDADFTDSPLLSFEEEMAEAEDQAEPGYSGPTFIGLDDLDHKRAVAGYRVRQHAKALMPFWTTDHNAALGELRNFAMGVTEGRWPDDGTRREELQALEATAARLNEITAARDEKLAFVDEATRDQIEAFDPEFGWP